MLLAKSIIIAVLTLIVAAILLVGSVSAHEPSSRAAGCANPAVTALALRPVHVPYHPERKLLRIVAVAGNRGALAFSAPEPVQLQLYTRRGRESRLIAFVALGALQIDQSVALTHVVPVAAVRGFEVSAVLVYGPAGADDCRADDNERRAQVL